MKVGHIGYHSFRGYAPDSESATAGGLISRLTAGVKRVLEMFLKLGARETAETVWLVEGDETHFSVLGSARDDKLLRAVAPRPFPEDQARERRPIPGRAEGE